MRWHMSDCDDYGYLSSNKIEKAKTSSSSKSKTDDKPRTSTSSDSSKKEPSSRSSTPRDTSKDSDDDTRWNQF